MNIPYFNHSRFFAEIQHTDVYTLLDPLITYTRATLMPHDRIKHLTWSNMQQITTKQFIISHTCKLTIQMAEEDEELTEAWQVRVKYCI